ncbi:MAG: hypothetical protein ACJ76X_02565 [Solirubrobacteraceae bacterium]|jgi:hypothetical protein
MRNEKAAQRPASLSASDRRGISAVQSGERAGIVTVTLDSTEGGSDVEVVYELTPLSEAGARHLERFAGGYRDYLRSWQDAIAASLETRAAR